MKNDEYKILRTEGPFHDRKEANRATLQQILRMGVARGEKKDVWNYFYFNKLKDAREAAQDLTEIGFQIEEFGESAGEKEILLLAKIRLSLEETTLDRLTEFLEKIADKFHGKYDGWEVEIDPQ